jgi:5'-phosphate synthase pdxT subunit
MKVGVLALQGAFREHVRMLRMCAEEALEIRLPEQLDGVDALIIPGGESTTISKLMTEYGFPGKIKSFAKSGKPVLGTCAGLILLAASQQGRKQKLLNLIDIDMKRNAYGRQIESREVDIEIPAIGPQPFHAVFIRAPQVESAGPGVEVLATYQDKIVLARQKNILICCFHPELTDDTRIHKYFLGMAK